MDGREQMQVQEQAEGHEKRSYENAPWINVHDWMVTKRINHETETPFWDIKIPSGTFLEVDGQKKDIGHYRFTTNYEPALTHGEAGDPKAMRGIHFPEGWEIRLDLIKNVAVEGHEPIFEVVDRIEGVTPKALSESLEERDTQWRATHRKPAHEQETGKDAQDQARPGRGMIYKPSRQAEPAL